MTIAVDLGRKANKQTNKISMHFRLSSEGQGTEWRIFFGLLKYLFGVLEIPDILLVNGRCWARAYI